MPEHGTWFDVLLGTAYTNLQRAASVLGLPFSEDGTSWIAHQPIQIGHLLLFGLVFFIVVGVAFRVSSRVADPKKVLIPDARFTLLTFSELIVGTTYGMMTDMMGAKAAKYFLPLIGTCAFVIFFSNVMGLIPGFLPPTSNLNVTFGMAIVIFLTTHIYGVREHGLKYFKHFLGPWLPLAPLMLPIELISHAVRPVTLGVRLMANMTADHLVVGIFIGLVPFVVPIPMYLMGVIVVTVQTLVFCLLSAIYISFAIAHEEH